MQSSPLTVLSRDHSVKSRLITACLVVTVLISAIYVTASYRLTADVNLQTELKTMQRLTRLFGSQLQRPDLSGQSLTDNVRQFIRAQHDNEDPTPRMFYIEGPGEPQSYGFRLSDTERQQLIDALASADSENHLINLDERSFLWQQYKTPSITITYILQTSVLDITMSFIAKRLIITSILVFWLGVWLALTLSSFIAKRVNEVNDALADIATHDVLTGLPNRLYLKEKLNQHITETNNNIKQGCILVIDLDKFKEVNDSLGHSAGDSLLTEVATKLSQLLYSPAELIRFGGDEFIIWSPGLAISGAEKLAQQIVDICDEPILINGLAVNIGASIGIAHYPSHATEQDTLIVCADTAMYKAKQQRCGWIVHEKNEATDYKSNLQLRAELTDALQQEQFILHFQPKVNLHTGHIVGVEGLCRWNHPRLGLIAPNQFIDLIENSGKVQEFGRYTIRKAIEYAAAWFNNGIEIPIAINLSPYNLLDPDLVEFIRKTLVRMSVPANRLEFELTENETSINILNIQSTLDKIKSLGISIAIDDFGTGMSSLAYLAQLNVNVLKIDRSFITHIEKNKGDRAIVASAITLANTFGCSLVAEGIEKASQASLLRSMGCHIGQGYLFAKPMPEEAIKRYLIKQTPIEMNDIA